MTVRYEKAEVHLTKPVDVTVQLRAIRPDLGGENAESSCSLDFGGIEIILGGQQPLDFRTKDRAKRLQLFKLEAVCCNLTAFESSQTFDALPSNEGRSFTLRNLCCEAQVYFGPPMPTTSSLRNDSMPIDQSTSSESPDGGDDSKPKGRIRKFIDRRYSAVKKLAIADTFLAFERRLEDLETQSNELEKGIENLSTWGESYNPRNPYS